MKIKKISADSMPDAMKMIRMELGDEAVILNSKVVYEGGFLGFFKKKKIEVIAAIDPQPKQPVLTKVAEPKVVKTTTLKPVPTEVKSEKIAKPSNDHLLKEVNELKQMIKNFASDSEPLHGTTPLPIKSLIEKLNDQEVSRQLQDHYLRFLLEVWYSNGSNLSTEKLQEHLETEINSAMADIPFGGISFTKKFVNVVGPTGVGKTTTLAKIAADCVIKHKKKVAFITTDTYRIAAIEQLRTYASILNIPVEVCYTLEDFQNATLKYRDYDVVLIDTAGRNFRNKKYVEDLKLTIDFDSEMETFLVLALTAKQRDMEAIYEQFSLIGIDKLIFTKADETSIYGAMLNMTLKHKVGVAYITNGQDVPDDMVLASPPTITNYLLGVH